MKGSPILVILSETFNKMYSHPYIYIYSSAEEYQDKLHDQ